MLSKIKRVLKRLFALNKADRSIYVNSIAFPAVLLSLSFIISTFVSPYIPAEEGSDIITETLSGDLSGDAFILLFYICILAPLAEELIFRGALWTALKKIFKKDLYILITTSVLFALAHGDIGHIIGVLPIGFYIGWLRMKGGSIFPCIVAHATNNIIVSFLIIFS